MIYRLKFSQGVEMDCRLRCFVALRNCYQMNEREKLCVGHFRSTLLKSKTVNKPVSKHVKNLLHLIQYSFA